MKQNGLFYLCILCIGTLTSCFFDTTKIEPSFRTETTTIDGDLQPPPNFAQFKDIPIPEQAKMDLKKTLLFGKDPMIGRLCFSAPYTQTNVFDFYMLEMPKFGWREITMTRTQNSLLIFSRDDRVATIQLTSSAVGGTDVLFDISLGNKKF